MCHPHLLGNVLSLLLTVSTQCEIVSIRVELKVSVRNLICKVLIEFGAIAHSRSLHVPSSLVQHTVMSLIVDKSKQNVRKVLIVNIVMF